MPHELDGTEVEFPHRQEAMRNIRAMWSGWLVLGDLGARDELAVAIADERIRICHGPGPLWRSFAATLPGYSEMETDFTASVFVGLRRSA